MANGTKKTGRKRKDFVNPETGLPVVGLSKMTDGRWRIIGSQTRFSAPDASTAIQKFYELTGQDETKAERSLKRRELTMRRAQMVEWARSLILDTPQLAAKELGIEWLAYGTSLPAPEKLPTLNELEQEWLKHGECSELQRKKVLRAWND